MTFDLPTLIAIRARLEQHAALSIFSGGPGVSPDRCRRILGWLGPVGGDITVRHYLWPNRQPDPALHGYRYSRHFKPHPIQQEN